LHKSFPEKHYELLNTSYTDAVYITAVEETRNIQSEIRELVKTFETLENSVADGSLKVARSNGPWIDMKVKSMFSNWRSYLTPFLEYLENDVNKLQQIPLGSKLDTKNENVKSPFITSDFPL
jgi:hypothetical protein